MIGRRRNLSIERRELVIEVRSDRDVRVDHYLFHNMSWRSRNRVQTLIREGRVTVNGRPAKPSRRVRHGDVVTIRLSSGTGVPDDYDTRSFPTLYEDPWLLALDKPAGILVHPVGRHVYDTLINYLHHRYHASGPANKSIVPRLCHRLDRDTTGLLVVAKDLYVHREVSRQFEGRHLEKSYLALAHGDVDPEKTMIDRAIGIGRSLDQALTNGVRRASRTSLEVLERYGSFTLLRASPETGRQNQIRIHLAAIGHPIAGDRRFGAPAPPPGFPGRYLLHSERLRLYHPRLKCEIELEAPLPPDFQSALAILGSKSAIETSSG